MHASTHMYTFTHGHFSLTLHVFFLYDGFQFCDLWHTPVCECVCACVSVCMCMCKSVSVSVCGFCAFCLALSFSVNLFILSYSGVFVLILFYLIPF